MGHVRIAENMNFQICCGGNGTCLDFIRVNIKVYFARKVGTPNVKKYWISKSVGVEMGQVRISGHRISTSDEVEMGHVRIPEPWIAKSVGMERGHTELQKRVNFKKNCVGNWACPHSRQGALPNLLWRKMDTTDSRKIECQILVGWEWDMSTFQKNELPNLLGMTGDTPDCRETCVWYSVWADIGLDGLAEKIEFPNLWWWELGTLEFGINWISKIVWVEMRRVRIPDKWIDKSEEVERGHTGLQKKVEFKNSLGGNWACPHCMKNWMCRLLWKKTGSLDVRKNSISKSVCHETHLFSDVVGWLVADAHCMLNKYWMYPARMDWLTLIWWGKKVFWARVTGANQVHLTFGCNVGNRFDETKLYQTNLDWAGSTRIFQKNKGWDKAQPAFVKKNRLTWLDPNCIKKKSGWSRLNPKCTKNNRVEPAQPDLFRKKASAGSTWIVWKKTQDEPARPDSDNQCVVKSLAWNCVWITIRVQNLGHRNTIVNAAQFGKTLRNQNFHLTSSAVQILLQ